jgi:DNA mismatch repair protein MutS
MTTSPDARRPPGPLPRKRRGHRRVISDVSPETPGQHQLVASLLSGDPAAPPGAGGPADQDVLADLRLDQVIAKIAGDRDERDLITGLLSHPVRDVGTLRYRHEVFRDLEEPGLFQAAGQFTAQLRQVRGHLGQLPGMSSDQQRAGWFLDAAAIYCDAVRAFAAELETRPVASRGLTAFRDYLTGYIRSAPFQRLAADTAARQADLSAITYQVRVKGPKVEVSRYDGEPDYSAEIEKTFERFQQGAVKDYRVRYRTRPGMNHVGQQILDLVARLFADEFGALAGYCREHAQFIDPAVGQLDRELQFYLAYLDYIRPLRAAGLSFCYPELSTGSKEVYACDTFDLALAAWLTPAGQPVVINDFRLTGGERVMVVTGPNQGGKTTFARTFGQLHHLAGTGGPVPGSTARLFLPDQVFTHFEREEDLGDLAGRLEDDLLRIQKALLAATCDSVVIMNEIFTSTTASDARFLGEKVLAKVIELDLLCVYVTFIDELASIGPAVVSVTSTIVPDNPAERTFKVVRKPADGLAYALAIARRHRVSYEQLKERLT